MTFDDVTATVICSFSFLRRIQAGACAKGKRENRREERKACRDLAQLAYGMIPFRVLRSSPHVWYMGKLRPPDVTEASYMAFILQVCSF
jgi:hypothetical protein